MRFIGFMISLILLLSSCTSTRSLSRKFSEKPVRITGQFCKGKYANSGQSKGYYSIKTDLWRTLASYRRDKDALIALSSDALIELSLVGNKVLRVTALEKGHAMASFEIPVKKRRKYLILKSKVRSIPIPLFFSMHEDKAVLATLSGGGLGYYHYTDETLWILFFGASTTGRTMHEYQPVDE